MRTVLGSRPPAAMRDGPLRGRVAMVTGAARGVGEALVRRLSAEGMRIALLGREEETLSQVAASLAVMTVCIEADVTDQVALDRAARQVEERLGPADVVVANAGIAVGGPFTRTEAELWRRVVDVNLVGAANTARAFLPQLERTGGYFLQIASTAAFGSAPMMSAYCASKAGAESFALALRGEVAPRGGRGRHRLPALDRHRHDRRNGRAPGDGSPLPTPAALRSAGPQSRTGGRLARHRHHTPCPEHLRAPVAALVPALAAGLPVRGRPHHPARTGGGVDRRARCRCRRARGGRPRRLDVGQARDLTRDGGRRRPEGVRQAVRRPRMLRSQSESRPDRPIRTLGNTPEAGDSAPGRP